MQDFIVHQVLEWNGINLIGKTFEDVEKIISASENEVEVVVLRGAVASYPPHPPPSSAGHRRPESANSFYHNPSAASSSSSRFINDSQQQQHHQQQQQIYHQEVQQHQQQQQQSSYGNPLSNTLRHYSNHELNQSQLARDLRVVSASGNDTYAHLEYADPYRDGGRGCGDWRR